MLTPAQFLYLIAKDADEKELKLLDGRCRLCGGHLFEFQGFSPEIYTEVIRGWIQEGLTRARESIHICPACHYLYGNSNQKVKPEFTDPGKPDTGLLKFDRRGSGKALAAIIASRDRGFQAFDKDAWCAFGENLFNPPEPPFLVLATEDRRGIQYGPWQSIIALSRDTFPVYFGYNVTVSNDATVANSTLVWINPTTFRKAVELVERCMENHVRIPDAPDWQLARKCAKKITN